MCPLRVTSGNNPIAHKIPPCPRELTSARYRQRLKKELGLGARRHHEALFRFASAWIVWFPTPTPCESFVWTSAVQCRDPSHALATALPGPDAISNCRRCNSRGCLARATSASHRDPAPGRVVQLARWCHSISLGSRAILRCRYQRGGRSILHFGTTPNSAQREFHHGIKTRERLATSSQNSAPT